MYADGAAFHAEARNGDPSSPSKQSRCQVMVQNSSVPPDELSDGWILLNCSDALPSGFDVVMCGVECDTKDTMKSPPGLRRIFRSDISRISNHLQMTLRSDLQKLKFMWFFDIQTSDQSGSAKKLIWAGSLNKALVSETA